MTTGHVYIAASLDGFIARENGDIDWLEKYNTPEDHGYNAFIESVDGIVMGRGTYEKVLTFDGWHYSKPVVMLSNKLTANHVRKDLVDRVSITSESPAQLMQRLDAEGWKRAYIDGGQVIQSFLLEGLIEDITLFRIPVLLGAGIPLFGPLSKDIALKHEATKAYPSGIVESKYTVE